MSKATRIQVTKNYRLFERGAENRPLDIKRHRKLEASMKRYGFLKSFPIICVRDIQGRLIVKDGQHRLAIAETLGLAVYWVEEEVDFDVAVINCTAKGWVLKDYALKHAANGLPHYREGIEFAESHGLPLGISFAMLAGTTTFNNVESQFVDGEFKIKDRPWANAVAGIYAPLVALAPAMKNVRFLQACMAVCRVPKFDSKRLIQGAGTCRDKLINYATKDAYLDMLERVYNFKRQQIVALKIEATKAMRERKPGKTGRQKPDADAV